MRVLTSRVVPLLVACLVGCAADRPETRVADQMEPVPVAGTKQQFDYYYHRWYRESERIKWSSRTQDYTGLPAFRSMVALGRPSLPYLQQKMEENRGQDFMLAQAVVEICGWSPEEFPHVGEQEFRAEILAKMKAEE